MKRIHYASYVLAAGLLCLLPGCVTNPPTSAPVPPVEYGKVFVTSIPAGCSISLDGSVTGALTPDTLTASAGSHTIGLAKDGYASATQTVQVIKDSVAVVSMSMVTTVQKVVLIEDFSNVSCVPCVASNKILESLVNGDYGHAKLLKIKYPTNFPSPNDTFYIHNPSDCNARISFYNVLFAPTTMADGISRPNAADSLQMKDTINSRLQQQARFKISVADSFSGGTYYVNVKVQTLDATGLDIAQLRLQTVVTETNIVFPNPPGSNGETAFYDVMRRMLPTSAGDALLSGSIVTYQRQVTVSPRWNTANIHTVAFIQNSRTKEIYQAGSTFH